MLRFRYVESACVPSPPSGILFRKCLNLKGINEVCLGLMFFDRGPAETSNAENGLEYSVLEHPAKTHAVELTLLRLSMNTREFERQARAIGIAIIGLLVLASGAASATQMTLTFDDGAYYPTLAPGGQAFAPKDWVENNGIRSAGFWARDVGTPGAVSIQGHTHIQPNFSGRLDGRVERMHAWTSDLQGLFISLESGSSFDVLSIDYSIRERESTVAQLQRANWATGSEDAQLLLSTSFDPTVSDLESQWTQFGIDDFDLPYATYFTRAITGFDNITGFYLSQTIASLLIDTIVLNVNGSGAAVPEPTTALLLGLGLAGIATQKRRG